MRETLVLVSGKCSIVGLFPCHILDREERLVCQERSILYEAILRDPT